MSELFIVGHLNTLSDALTELESWERDALFYGVGSAYLGFKNSQFLILISEELMNAILPH